MVKQEHPQAVKEAAQSILPAWLDAFKFLLNINPTQDIDGTPNWDGVALRIQIFKVRTASSHVRADTRTDGCQRK